MHKIHGNKIEEFKLDPYARLKEAFVVGDKEKASKVYDELEGDDRVHDVWLRMASQERDKKLGEEIKTFLEYEKTRRLRDYWLHMTPEKKKVAPVIDLTKHRSEGKINEGETK